jgi:hypothetical protein
MPDFLVAFAPDPSSSDQAIEVQATRQMSAGRSFASAGDYRLITLIAETENSPIDIVSAYVDVFGALRAGSKIFIRCRCIATSGAVNFGIATPWRLASCIVS